MDEPCAATTKTQASTAWLQWPTWKRRYRNAWNSYPFLIKFSSQLTVVDERRYAGRQRSVFSGLWECRAVVVVVLMTCERGSRFLWCCLRLAASAADADVIW